MRRVYIQAKELYEALFAKYMTQVNSDNVLWVYFEKVRGPVRKCVVHLPALGWPVVARLGPSRAWAGLGRSPCASAVTACSAQRGPPPARWAGLWPTPGPRWSCAAWATAYPSLGRLMAG